MLNTFTSSGNKHIPTPLVYYSMREKGVGVPHAKILTFCYFYDEVVTTGTIAKAVKCHNLKYFNDLFDWGLIALDLSSKSLCKLWQKRVRLTMRGSTIVECALLLVKLMGVDVDDVDSVLSDVDAIKAIAGCMSLLNRRTSQQLSQLLKLLRNIHTTSCKLYNF